MKKIAIVSALLAVSLILAPAAMADGGEQGDWEFGPYVGATIPDDYQGLNPGTDVMGGFRIGYFIFPQFSIEASYQRFSTKTDFDRIPVNGGGGGGGGGEFGRSRPRNAVDNLGVGVSNFDMKINSARGNLLWNFIEGSRFRPFVTVGAGVESLELHGITDQYDLGVNAGGGIRYFFTDRLAIRADARYVYTDVNNKIVEDDWQGNVEGTVGLSWAFGADKTDTDGDGVYDRKDKCPDTPRGALVDAAGCPKDTDGDGVYDGIDACPDTPRGYPVDARGCPLDSDGDGVVDGADKCPNTPKGATVDANGCPKDSDGDGVYDGIDRCPDTPKGCMVDAAGCPKDSDGDGVCDGLDKCPGTPRGEAVDATGCSSAPQFEEGKSEVILKGVQFPTDGFTLDAEDKAILDEVAASLADHPEVTLVEVGGHTDSTGSAAHNRTLSGKRADSAMKYLESKGVAASRMTAKGYGPDVPIADNGTKEGRAQNRRTEVKRVN